jgi:hypothetical protein
VLTKLNDLKVEESMILKLRLMIELLLVDLLKKVVLRVMLAQMLMLMLVNESPENKRSNLGDMVDVDVGLKLKIEM